jgi:PhnB protein
MTAPEAEPPTKARVVPELSVRHGRAAVDFYQRAFGAVEEYRVGGTDDHEDIVAQLSVGGATFWVADESPAHANYSPESLGGAIGHFIRDLPVAGHAGHLPYVYVESLDETLQRVTSHGGTIVRRPFPEGNLWVATIHDPAQNVLGLWQRGPRV